MPQAATAAWGDPGVTELQILKDNSIALSAIGATPVTAGQGLLTLQHVGLLKRLRLKCSIPFTVAAFATSPTLDVNGPWNLLNQVRIDVNGIAPLYVASGFGLYLISLISNSFATVETPTGTITTDPSALTDVFSYPAVTANGALQLTFAFDLPFTVDISLPGQQANLATELGLWVLQNQTVDMIVTASFNALQGASPGVQPYQGGTGSTYSYGSAVLDAEREFYRIPSDPAAMPPLSWAHQWVETYIPVAGSSVDLPIARAGIVLRAIVYIWDGATSDGALSAKVSAVSYVYGANETPMVIDPVFNRQRQMRDYGRLLPKGTYAFDWYLWGGKSFKLTYNTEAIVNQRIHIDFTSAMAAGSYIRFLVERLIPIVANRTASPVATSGAPVGAQQAALAK